MPSIPFPGDITLGRLFAQGWTSRPSPPFPLDGYQFTVADVANLAVAPQHEEGWSPAHPIWLMIQRFIGQWPRFRQVWRCVQCFSQPVNSGWTYRTPAEAPSWVYWHGTPQQAANAFRANAGSVAPPVLATRRSNLSRVYAIANGDRNAWERVDEIARDMAIQICTGRIASPCPGLDDFASYARDIQGSIRSVWEMSPAEIWPFILRPMGNFGGAIRLTQSPTGLLGNWYVRTRNMHHPEEIYILGADGAVSRTPRGQIRILDGTRRAVSITSSGLGNLETVATGTSRGGGRDSDPTAYAESGGGMRVGQGTGAEAAGAGVATYSNALGTVEEVNQMLQEWQQRMITVLNNTVPPVIL